MSYIHINQLNFEFEESNVYHDILSNNGLNTPALIEQIVSVAHIYVSQINLELPVAEVPTDTLTNTGNNTQTIEEVITGTPVPTPEEPVVTGGGAGQRPRVLGGRPFVKEILISASANEQEIEDATYVEETIEVQAKTINGVEAKVRRPIYRKTREIEVVPYTMVKPSEVAFTSRSRKEEEEFILFGII